MARCREYSYEQERTLPASLVQQIQPGTFEYTLNYLVDHEIDLEVFENHGMVAVSCWIPYYDNLVCCKNKVEIIY